MNNETQKIQSFHFDEQKISTDIQRISTHRDKNERLSFKRKKDKMEELVKELNIVNDKILKITLDEVYPIQDKITELRIEMVKECVHPKDQLVHYGNYVLCKFCEARITLAGSSNDTE